MPLTGFADRKSPSPRTRSDRSQRFCPVPETSGTLDGVAIKIAGKKHWLWRAVDQDGVVLDILVQGRRDKRAVKRLLQKLLKKQRRPPRVLITDKPASYGAAKGEIPGSSGCRNACLSRS